MAKFTITRAEYQDLDWVVQVRYAPGPGSWESMAAFNHHLVATDYAKSCKKTNPRNAYRVLELSKIQPIHSIIFETDRVSA